MNFRLLSVIAAITFAASGVIADAKAATTIHRSYMHTGPGDNYPLVTPVPSYAAVKVRNCAGSWCRVTWNGYGGYLAAFAIASPAAYPKNRVTYGVAPRDYQPDAPSVAGYGYPFYCDPVIDPTCDYNDSIYGYGGYGYGGYGNGWGGHGHWGHGGHGFGGGGHGFGGGQGFGGGGFGGGHGFGGGGFGGGHGGGGSIHH